MCDSNSLNDNSMCGAKPILPADKRMDKRLCIENTGIFHSTQHGRKWTTFRLLPSAKVADGNLDGVAQSFVKVGVGGAGHLSYCTKAEEAQITPELPDSRPCGSPESGIDCDDVNMVDDCCSSSLHGIGDMPPPYDCNVNECVQMVNDEQVSPNTSNMMVCKRMDTDLALITGRGENSQISDFGYSDTQEQSLQIISVHSLAQSDQKSEGLISVGTTQKSPANMPLPKCTRLYIRKIKGMNRLMKKVLLVEANYSTATALPPLRNKNIPLKLYSGEKQAPSTKEVPKNISGGRLREQSISKCGGNKSMRKNHAESSIDNNERMIVGRRNVGKRLGERAHDAGCNDNFDERLDLSLEGEIGNNQRKNVLQNHLVGGKDCCGTDDKSSSHRGCETKPDRISQLREKLRQKEADLEEIRKNMCAMDRM